MLGGMKTLPKAGNRCPAHDLALVDALRQGEDCR
jgi:hypothetical protein